MHPDKSQHIDEFHKLVGDLAAIDTAISDEDQALLLITSLPSSDDSFVETLLYDQDTLKLKDVLATLNSRELQKMMEADVMVVLDFRADGYDNAHVMMAMSVEELLDWIIDSWGLYHITHRRDYLVDFEEYGGGNILLDDGRECRMQGTCKVQVQMKDGSSFMLDNVKEKHLAWELLSYREDSNEATFAVAAVDKIYAHESLTFNNTVACEVISKWKTGLKDYMDARSDVYVLSNSCRKCSDDSDVYYWEYTPGMFIHLFLYIDGMGFSCRCKAEIWATKDLLDKAKGNILGMEIIKDQSGNTLRVSQSKFYNRKLVQTLLEGHSILSLKGSLSGDYDVEKNDVGMLDKFDRGLQIDVHVFVDFDYAIGRSITKYGLMIQECARSWEAMRLHMMALSTTKASYMTLTEAAKEAIWLVKDIISITFMIIGNPRKKIDEDEEEF
nr:zinc finger, CCHC-type [Tanacetum cinerariifolium]